MKHAGELAVTGVLLKAVKTSRVRTTQDRTTFTKCRRLSLAFVAHILQTHMSRITSVAKLQLNTVKAKGSWVTADTPARSAVSDGDRHGFRAPLSYGWTARISSHK